MPLGPGFAATSDSLASYHLESVKPFSPNEEPQFLNPEKCQGPTHHVFSSALLYESAQWSGQDPGELPLSQRSEATLLSQAPLPSPPAACHLPTYSLLVQVLLLCQWCPVQRHAALRCPELAQGPHSQRVQPRNRDICSQAWAVSGLTPPHEGAYPKCQDQSVQVATRLHVSTGRP